MVSNIPFKSQPKSQTESRGKVGPIRSQGETETRINLGNPFKDESLKDNTVVGAIRNGQVNPNQIEQLLDLRSNNVNFGGDEFSYSSEEARKNPGHIYDYINQVTNADHFDPHIHRALVEEILSNPNIDIHAVIGRLKAESREHPGIGPILPNHVYGTRGDFKYLEVDPPIHVFMLDESSELTDKPLHLSKEELRLPYNECIFIVGKKKSIHFKAVQLSPLCVEFEVTQINGYGNNKYLEKKGRLAFTYTLINGVIHPNTLDKPAKPILQASHKILTTLIGLSESKLFRQAVTNDTQSKTKPVKQSAKGTVFKILDISFFRITVIRPLPKGGTHASPREHWRRGHWRRNRQGDIYWQKPLLINKGVRGRVDKAYHLIELKRTRNDNYEVTQNTLNEGT